MISGTGSGSGKTTVTAGLMRALAGRLCAKAGREIVPFKCGPDYIDPMFHRFACGSPSVNLDTVLLGDDGTRRAFNNRMAGRGPGACAIVEGAMGLYDGQRDTGKGSAADTAVLLDLPVFLIIDGRGMSQSAAALVGGFRDYDPRVRISGIIVNRIKNESHYRLLSEIIETQCGIPCVGWFPEDPALRLESRHLRLIPAEELESLSELLDRAADSIADHFDLGRILELSYIDEPAEVPDPFEGCEDRYRGLRIGVARDKAFNFYYTENLELLKKLGIELKFFSPIADAAPPEVDALWFGGGYPEVFADRLEENVSMRKAVRAALEAGLPCYAECGGQIYLAEKIVPGDGKPRAGVGFLPDRIRMTDRLQRFGYADLEIGLEGRSFGFPVHEFHHSVLEGDGDYRGRLTKGTRRWPGMQVRKNTLAGYPHFHFYAAPDGPALLRAMLDKAVLLKEQR